MDVAVVPHARERLGMKHLCEQRGDPTDHHRRDVAVDPADDGAGRKQRVVGSRNGLFAPGLIVESATDLPDERSADRGQHGYTASRLRRFFSAAVFS